MKTTKRKKAGAVEPFVISDALFLIADAVKANARAVREIEKKVSRTEKQIFRKMARQHSDVLDLLDGQIKRAKDGLQLESYYECLQRILNER